MGEIKWRGDIGRRDILRSEKKHKGGLSRRYDVGFIYARGATAPSLSERSSFARE